MKFIAIWGRGFLESVYEKALIIEMTARQIPFENRKKIAVSYKDHLVGLGEIDFLVGQVLVVELKAVDAFAPIHLAQTISYLKALDLPLGLLINFNVSVLKAGVKRLVRTTAAAAGSRDEDQ